MVNAPEKEKVSFVTYIKSLEQGYQGMLDLYKKAYQEYLSDTLTVITKENEIFYPEIFFALKNTNQTKKFNHLKNIYIEKEFKNFTHKADISKESVNNLRILQYVALLNNDYNKYADIVHEIYFVRKDKNNYINIKMDALMHSIENQKPIKEVLKRIDKDIENMKANAVSYLKTNNYWKKEWE